MPSPASPPRNARRAGLLSGWWRILGGPLVIVAILAAQHLLAGSVLGRLNLMPLCLLVVVYATFSGGLLPGLTTAAIALADLAVPRPFAPEPFPATADEIQRLLIFGIVAPGAVVVTHILRRRLEGAVRDRSLAQALVGLRTLVEGVEAVVWEANPATRRFLFISRGLEPMLGYAPARWIEEPDLWESLQEFQR